MAVILRQTPTQDPAVPPDSHQPETQAPSVAEVALRQALAERDATVQALQRQREVFAHGISHDLRAPLRAIESYSRILARHGEEALDAVSRDYLQRIRSAAGRMGGLIESLLDYSRVEAGELAHAPVDLSLLADLALAELQDAEPTRTLRASVAPGLVALGDERQFGMLMTQLLRNAWAFSGDEVVVDVSGERDGERLRLTVRDQGIGFDMQHAAKLFEPFQRLHGEDRGAGNGIGLAIAQRIVERHGGRIWGESRPGGGSTFSVELPGRSSASTG